MNRPIRILWVDDDETIVRIAKRIIHTLGFEGDAVRSGAEGLHRLAHAEYDIVVTDIEMPDMHGWEFVGRIRGRYGASPKILVVTGWGGADASLAPARRQMADMILRKPVSLSALQNAVLEVARR